MGFFTLRGFVFVFTQISFGTLTQLGCGTSLGADVIILEIVSPEKKLEKKWAILAQSLAFCAEKMTLIGFKENRLQFRR
jgi:hypothetical protein